MKLINPKTKNYMSVNYVQNFWQYPTLMDLKKITIV